MDLERKRKHNRDANRKKRKAWFDANGPCVKCGSWKNLELDHVDPKTKISHTVWSWCETKRLAELEKCQALCKICHREKTSNELKIKFKNSWKHGTLTGYYNWKCKCDLCKYAYSKYRRFLYLKKGI